jgi:FkbM family methyltransferase
MPLSLRLLQRDGIIEAVGFDPGRTDWALWVHDLLDKILRLPKLDHIPIALADIDGPATLQVTRHPGCSSLRVPNFDALSCFEAAPLFQVVRQVSLAVRRMDSAAAEFSLKSPDIVKMDVQGAESLVLQGMGKLLEHTVCLEFETRMRPLYIDEWSFNEYYDFLRSHGFNLLKLEQHQTVENESIEYMAYFSRTPRNRREQAVRDLFSAVNGIDLKSGYSELLSREGHLIEG